MSPAPWTTGIVFNAKSLRPNVIVWSGKTAVARDVAAADAALICAAPDLLEALEMVLDADSDCHLDGLRTIPTAARAKIDAAIAKARNTFKTGATQ